MARKDDPAFDPAFQVGIDFEPCYLEGYRDGSLFDRLEPALAELESCVACPRRSAEPRPAIAPASCVPGLLTRASRR